jgi:ArsR family transcriptional regulator, nickel/cobalt-responsive transcriptional repressor
MPRPEHDPKAQAAWLAAIAQPTRLKILRALADGGRTVTELAKACGVAAVNISGHLQILTTAGLLVMEPDGWFRRYSLAGVTRTATHLELTHVSGLKVTLTLL